VEGVEAETIDEIAASTSLAQAVLELEIWEDKTDCS